MVLTKAEERQQPQHRIAGLMTLQLVAVLQLHHHLRLRLQPRTQPQQATYDDICDPAQRRESEILKSPYSLDGKLRGGPQARARYLGRRAGQEA